MGLEALSGAVAAMAAVQEADGALPWFAGGPWDPWNHGECVMALAVAGETSAAERGLACLAARQAPDGGWLGEYGNLLPLADRLHLARVKPPAFRDTNFAAYPATVAWRMFRLKEDAAFARRWLPMVEAAMGFVLANQHPEGDVSWSAEAHGTPADDAVLAGNASIHKSLDCALKLAEAAGASRPAWREARRALGQALRERPERFDRAGTDRSGFAMDWYYPALSGALAPPAAAARIDAGWRRFVELGIGCRCVAHEPWATVAESCELVMTLARLGRTQAARDLFDWQLAHRDETGAFWMGWQFDEQIVWPVEQPAWTQAAAILALDVLDQATPGWDVLVS